MNMLRAMSGCIGLAICAALLSAKLDAELPAILSPGLVSVARDSLREGNGISGEELVLVRRVYGRGYDSAYRVMIAFAAANVLVAGGLVWAASREGVGRLVEDARAREGGITEGREGD